MINAFAAAGDVAIAGILCTILQVSKTGFQRSTMLINKLVGCLPCDRSSSFVD